MRLQTEKEEFFNVASHGLGFILSVIGFILLLIFQKYDSFQGVLGVTLYGLSLGTLYFASTRYHFEKEEEKKLFYRKLDHISIYLLIAGTYSPVLLITLPESNGWLLFWIVWGIAALGTILKIFFTGRFEIISLLLYLVMGWLIVFDFSALKTAVDTTGLYLLMAGGAAYTLGIFFYVFNKMKYNHVIWHIFVLSGSVLHYLFILFSVV